MADSLVALLIWVVVLGIVAAICYAIINALPLPAPFKQIALLVLLLLLLLLLLVKFLPLLTSVV